MTPTTYKDSGVDLELYEQAMARLPKLMHRTFSPRVLRNDGGFAGLFQLDFNSALFARNYREPVLISGTDGVGTKLKVAQLLGSAQHGRHRFGGHVRQRYFVLRCRAAVFSRLRCHESRQPTAAGADRRWH